jgi:hypothetical protein
MSDILVLFSAIVIAWILLRSQGGEGMTIRFKMLSLKTPEGKRQRIVVISAMLILFIALTLVALHGQQPYFLLKPFMIGAAAFLLYHLAKKKD